ncbi:hypothetical protein BsWGS_22758 [Bradybaena similaris]
MFATQILQLMFVASSVLLQIEGVFHQGETSEEGHHREKRQTTLNGFNDVQRAAIVEHHNHFRALTKAKNMPKLTWDPQLENLAQNFAAQCKVGHNPNRNNVAGFQYVGENIGAGTADFDPKATVEQWYNEINDYDYSSNTCAPGKTCGHYTQVVSAKTTAIGCGVTYCPRFKQTLDIGFSAGYLVVCNYGPGARSAEKPYEAATP